MYHADTRDESDFQSDLPFQFFFQLRRHLIFSANCCRRQLDELQASHTTLLLSQQGEQPHISPLLPSYPRERCVALVDKEGDPSYARR